MITITLEGPEQCWEQDYRVQALDCPFGSIIRWSTVFAPQGVNPADVVFLNPNAADTRVTLPPFPGEYGIRATCDTPS